MYHVILSTCPSQEVAEQIADTLVKENLAACINILPQITSIYQWQGKIERDQEVQLLIKTKVELFPVINDRITQLHPYDVPEVIALDITQGSHAYLQWIDESLAK
ncbi:divalent-cation tolerance protein CutA [Thalassotalea insulae]|uniref:Divalent-cation tolerance protein CutA n=1 Tax=Thalassotalea insulae TaxID=2056778 RepID=A0ABQ6GUV9_9GAMM|nr:divalent-cation tolerance protein CutA [Thalassotalea insulae]GLX78969.1 divalent-cation tolerance protein CutA [Thalassotalea insulae]